MLKGIIIKCIGKNKIYIVILAVAAVFVCSALFGRDVIPIMANKKTDEAIKIPVIMYHSVINNSSRAGKYVITPEQMESDLIFLKENGYNTIFVQDLIDYVYSGIELPENPVVLSFDDGCYNNQAYVLPLLEKYDAKAIISIVGKYTDMYTEQKDENPNYASLSWDNVNELIESGRIEIGNHSDNMHYLNNNGRKGCHKKWAESDEEYKKALRDDLGKLQSKCLSNAGITPVVFTYPFGCISPESSAVVEELGFLASLSCEEGMNYIMEKTPEELYLLKRFIRTDVRSVKDIFKAQKLVN